MRLLSIGLILGASMFAQAPPSLPAEAPPPAGAKPAAAKPKTATAKAAQPAAAGMPSLSTLKFPPLREVRIPDVAQFTLPNGMKLYLLENHELPLVSGFAMVRTGNLLDPKDKVGLAQLTGMVMRTGGTRTRTGDELDEQLENIAASVESGIGETSGRVSFNTLKENTDQVLAVFKEVLTSPEFRQDKLDLAKSQLKGSIARRNDEPSGIAGRELEQILYGPDTPFGWELEYHHLENIQRQDLTNFYSRHFFPSNIVLAVLGDFNTAEMRAKLEKLFADWQVRQEPVPALPSVTAKPAPGINLVARDDVTQTFFALGHLGGVLKDPNYPALSVMADILGGGFSSRLFKEVRTRLGYAYGVDASWGAEYGHPGLFRISGSTKSPSTVDTITSIRKELEKIRTTEVTDQELATAKQSVLNSFVFFFDSPSKILNRLVTYDYYGYPKDFIFQYQKGVEKVTKADVLRVAKEYLKPEVVTTVAVGKPADFGKALTTLGAVQALDVSIPDPKQAATKADAGSVAKGKQALARLQQAVGGAEKLAAVKDMSSAADVVVESPQGQMKITQANQWVAPNSFRQTIVLPFGKVESFTDGVTGWMASPQGTMNMPAPILKQAQGELFRNPFRLYLSDRDPGNTVNAVNDNTIEITDKAGNTVTLHLDPATGLPVKSVYPSIGQTGPITVEATVSDWRDIGGIKLPHKILVLQDGKKFGEATVTEIKLNSGVKLEELSKKP